MKKGVENSDFPPSLKILTRGGGSSEHDIAKLNGWHWLFSRRYSVIDFEIGGFDILGLNPEPSDFLCERVVIDAQTSKAGLVSHFRKSHISDCDIDGKFSKY